MFRQYPMSVDFSACHSFISTSAAPPPQPGEIWQVRRELRSPLTSSNSIPPGAYSLPAQRFLQGDFPAHYVMIVRELEPEIAPEDSWQTFSAMVLSEETTFLSDVDVMIPASVSGAGKDLLAETWQVLPILGCNLQQPVGNRLTRAIYNGLMTIGDAAESGLANQGLSQRSLEALGLAIASPLTHQHPNIQAFHQQEADWSDVLTVPFAAYQTYLKSLQWADVVLAKTLEVEQNLQSLTVVSLPTIARQTILLRNWFNQLFEPKWVAISELTNSGVLHLGLSPSRQAGDRNSIRTGSEVGDGATPEEITELIGQLSTASAEVQRRRAAKQLGAIASGNPEAIQALIDLLRSTEDDETLWAAVESLWQIDPGNPAAGVRRVRLVDLGLQVAGQTVALAVAMIQRSDQRIGVMLRIYPTGDEPYVPENLKLVLFDDSSQTYEVSARRNDLYVQLKFNGRPGEPFSVQVSLGSASVTEDFVL